MSGRKLPRRRDFLAAGTAGLVFAGLPTIARAQANRPRRPGPSIEREHLRDPQERTGKARAKKAPPQDLFGPRETLRYGTPKQAGLLAEHVGRIDGDVAAGMQPSPEYPRYPGAVALVARNGVIAKHDAYGHALKYADDKPTLLPENGWVPMRDDTIFDLASVSKLFTSIAAVQLVERDRLDLDAAVASYIPAFAPYGKEGVTVRHLLTHTSGFTPWLPLYSSYETPEERIAAVYAQGLDNPPGTAYAYSDLNLITLGKLVEELSGPPLNRFVAENVTGPLGMKDTGYNPPPEKLDRIAATEYQPWTERGMVRGSVHDENAWSLSGVAGHAGVFATAKDLAILAQTVLNGGRYGKARIMEPASVATLLTNYNQAFPGNDHGLGFELYQHWYMDAMATPVTAGHTGYTGTSLVINPLDRSFAILLTNRVHPSRSWGTVNPYRRAVARDLARAVAVAVKPDRGKEAWFSGLGDNLDNTLDLPLALPEGPKELRFALWYDTEPEFDHATLEASTDGGATWEPPRGTISGESFPETPSEERFTGWSGREWLDAAFDLGPYAGPVILRLRYATDDTSNGRGVYVDRVQLKGPRSTIFDDSRPRDMALWRPSGWTLSED